MQLKPLFIGELVSKLPIIQGGMGVGVSLSGLAGAVAACGGVGVISAAQIGFADAGFEQSPLKTNLESLARHIHAAKEKALGGLVGVNIMCATKGYEQYVETAAKAKADLLICGAGLPVNLPELIKNFPIKIAPIVSSLKAAKVLLNLWDKRYQKTADMVVVEGPKAGGHLAFTQEIAETNTSFDEEIKDIIHCVAGYEEKFNKKIPVVFGGGVYDHSDIEHCMSLGCSGVQIASRFVATTECDAHENFKQAYIHAKKEDAVIIKSPVGMPGRALLNEFVRRTSMVREEITKCYSCLEHCDPKTIPYCITKALITSVRGDVDNGLVFCGANVGRINKMMSVKELMEELTGAPVVL